MNMIKSVSRRRMRGLVVCHRLREVNWAEHV